MKKVFLFLMIVMHCCNARGAMPIGYTFYTTTNGVSTAFTAISESNFQCAIGISWESTQRTSAVMPTEIGAGIPTDYNGSFVIPSFLDDYAYSVTQVGYKAFYGCTGLTGVTIPNSITYIDNNAFRYTGLKSVTIPGSVEIIEGYSFGDCVSLTSVVLNNGTVKINNSAFSGCKNLSSIDIPVSVTSIGAYAFGTEWYDGRNGCEKLTVVKVRWNTPISIQDNTFSNAANAVLYVPKGTKNDYAVADGWKLFKEIKEITPIIAFSDTKVKEICVANWDTDGDGELSEGEAADVTNISNTFKGNNSITSFDEFRYFTGLKSIPRDAFSQCTSLASISIPNGVTTIIREAFNGCKMLSSISIPEGVKTIGTEAFGSCEAIKEITFPSTISSIGDCAFEGCNNLCSIVLLSNNPPDIGSASDFSNYNNITVFVPKGKKVNYESDNCWKKFKEIVENTIINFEDDLVKSICVTNWDTDGDGELCQKEVRSVTNLGGVFGGTGIETFNELQYFLGLNNISGFRKCNKLRSINLPRSVIRIEEEAFERCSSLTDILIPNSVTTISEQAFRYCYAIDNVSIPESVTFIGEKVFANCSGLTSVSVNIKSPLTISETTFSNRTNATLYVPWGCKSAYEAAEFWNEFKEIVEYGNSEITMGANGISTYSHSIDLDFTDVNGLKAYIASGYSPSTGELTMTRVYKVPAGEGLLLKGTAGNYDVPYAEVDNIYANMLVGVPTVTTVSPTDGSYTNFILSNGSNGIGFYTLSKTGDIAAGKAYLRLPTSTLPAANARRINLLFDDEENKETTGVNDGRSKMGEKSYSIYSLSGQRVKNPAKGLYVKNGKKIIVK